jgi:hypothetical protein
MMNRRLWLEPLEERALPSGVTPKSLLIYYGYPSLINHASSLSAAATLGAYNYVVLGDGLEDPSHPDHQNTAAILADPHMAHTTAFGYIDLGVTTQNLTLSEIETRVDEWQATGVQGIFLDDFGYDFGTTRDRQNAAVDYVHSKGLPVTANAFVPADAFDNVADPVHNPAGTPTHLGASDYYLYESFQIQTGKYVTESTWQAKAAALQGYEATLGFKVLAITTNSAANTYSQSKFFYAWYSALLYGYEAVGWGEYAFSSSSSQAPYRTRPATNPGTVYLGGVVNASPLYTRDTDAGQVQVNAATHAGAFKTHTLVLSGLPATVPAGMAEPLTVTVRDATGNVVTGYTGTVHFQSSDRAALLPADYPFTSADQGQHTFSVTLNTAGAQTITVTDTTYRKIAGKVSVTVGASAAFWDELLAGRNVGDQVRKDRTGTPFDL